MNIFQHVVQNHLIFVLNSKLSMIINSVINTYNGMICQSVFKNNDEYFLNHKLKNNDQIHSFLRK